MAFQASGPNVLVGAGNMGGAMLKGWLAAGIAGSDVVVLDPSPKPEMLELIGAHGIRHEAAAPDGLTAGVLFVAIKPQMMAGVLPALRALKGAETVTVSIAAGTPVATIEAHLGAGAVVRAMPNTPAMVGRGITAAVPNAAVTPDQRRLVDELLSVSGPVEWLDEEALIDAVTAVSGSGPAYAFFLVECMAEAGRAAGLPDDLAMRLARATVSGVGEMLHVSDAPAETLRKNVTSPGGTTAAALSVLMAEDGMKPLFVRAVAAAKKRAEELAG
jgi:pyrroline-5-carboxylate reductase